METGPHFKVILQSYTKKGTGHRDMDNLLSTDHDRTIMSAQATLAGLYPPTSGQIWNRKILWQPIPVRTLPQSLDYLYAPIPGCPRYDRIQNDTMKSNIFQRKILPYTITHHYPIPGWATPAVLAKLEELSDLTLLSLFGIYKRREKSLLQGGLIVKAVLKDIIEATKRENKRKLMVYSAHATTIAAFQIALNVYNGKVPPWSSCQFIELYEDINGQYTIEMYYRNDTSGNLHQLTLPGCSIFCSLPKFIQLVSPVIVADRAQECHN
ncbi:PREDICTED: prostatic acid phosphatase-like [Gekko japonicus]|uniref:acid phosphatase n=1 Tax=Gekko japonicus TaxID=146911 RepID=A0ABM1JNM5_GEKJA|nr:PREDICTED: prostatic acid phosphatase-like [Gekko japonicus]